MPPQAAAHGGKPDSRAPASLAAKRVGASRNDIAAKQVLPARAELLPIVPISAPRRLPKNEAEADLRNDLKAGLAEIAPPLKVGIVAEVKPRAATAKPGVQVDVGSQHAHLRASHLLECAITMAHEAVAGIIFCQPPALVQPTCLPSSINVWIGAPPTLLSDRPWRLQFKSGWHQRPQALPDRLGEASICRSQPQIPTVGLHKVRGAEAVALRALHQSGTLVNRQQPPDQPHLEATDLPRNKIVWRSSQQVGPICANRDLPVQIESLLFQSSSGLLWTTCQLPQWRDLAVPFHPLAFCPHHLSKLVS
eukprot:CAMPEP_0171189188 /NCGR_PEP_ID=MMETSP0790-20130122/18217_1 /TAXON_ID=2925 /ORGANISM="Alexandrium catenella, Strain OF101" /LENGTH=306 /DNA_ID=CAMNT_0011654291 /DNA_START=209 /DNA_END=1130 /DNA_ORIENTATION=+